MPDEQCQKLTSITSITMQISRHTHTRYKPPVISEAIKPILFTNAANVQLN